VPNLGEDTPASETHVTFSLPSGPDGDRVLGNALRPTVTAWTRGVLADLVRGIEGAAAGRTAVIDGKIAVVSGQAAGAGQAAGQAAEAKPAADAKVAPAKPAAAAAKPRPAAVASTTAKSSTTTSSSSSASSSSRYDFKIVEEFQCNPPDLFESLVDPRRVMAWAQSPAEIEPRVGGKCTMFGGSIEAEFTAFEPPTAFTQRWRFRSWPQGHYSTVKMTVGAPPGLCFFFFFFFFFFFGTIF
jgi:hypothetical protein